LAPFVLAARRLASVLRFRSLAECAIHDGCHRLLDECRNVKIDVESGKLMPVHGRGLVVLDLLVCAFPSLARLDGKHKTTSVAERDDEQVEPWDVLHGSRTRVFVVEPCPPARCNFGVVVATSCSAMMLLPKRYQLVKMLCCQCQYMAHIRLASIARPDRVGARGKRNHAVARRSTMTSTQRRTHQCRGS